MAEVPRLPSNLVDSAETNERQKAWIEGLPKTIARLAQRWSVDLAPPFQPGGRTAWVAPAQTADGSDVVVKVAWRHPESQHEADGLREWDGNGAVRLHASVDFDDTIGLLIERCRPGTTLAEQSEMEQDVVIAALLPRLWREPPSGHRFRSLQLMCEQWADEAERKIAAGHSTIDHGMAREGIALFRSLPMSAARHVLLCTDLHAENVLAAEREPWLMIDPKPHVGDPTYDALQHMLNCDERLQGDPRRLAARMADLLGLDGEQLLLWLFARCVVGSPSWPALAEVARRIAPT
jgi:streptomycin 6-kinase